MKKYIIEYDLYDDILGLLGHEVPHSNLKNVKTVIVELTQEEYEALVGAGINIKENYIPSPEKAILSWPADIPYRTYPLLTGGFNDYMKVPEAHLAGFDGTGIKIGLLDTGCQPANQALCMPSLVLQDYTGTGTGDVWSHGSKGCMVLAQKYSFFVPGLEVYTGIAKGATVYSMNVLAGGISATIDAIDYCIANNIDIINISLDFSFGLDTAINAALDAGIIVVCASGNSTVNPIAHPANIPGVICVNGVDVLVPGMPIAGSHLTSNGNTQVSVVSYMGGHYEFFSGGTSQAAWQLSGILAIYKQKYPTLNSKTAGHLLERRALEMDGYNYTVPSDNRDKLVNYVTGGGFLAPIN